MACCLIIEPSYHLERLTSLEFKSETTREAKVQDRDGRRGRLHKRQERELFKRDERGQHTHTHTHTHRRQGESPQKSSEAFQREATKYLLLTYLLTYCWHTPHLLLTH